MSALECRDLEPSASPSARPFVGRASALGLLARTARDAAAGLPGVVLVEGEPGVGRTALVRRAAGALTDFTVVHIVCDPMERDAPLQVVARLLGRFDAVVDRGAGVADAGEVLWQVLVREQARSPLAVVVDDLHWADSISVDVLGYALRRLFRERVLVVLTMLDPAADVTWSGRFPPDGAALTRRRRVVTAHNTSHELTLTGLDPAEFAALARAHGRDVHPADIAALHRYTAGHPGQASMLLADRGLTLRAAEPFPVPRTFLALLRDGVAELPDESRQLAMGLAVLGGPSRISLVARVSGVAEPADALEPLLIAGFARWRPADPVCPVEIAYPMLAAGIYQSIPPGRRRRLHERAAELVDAPAVWRHRVRAVVGAADPELADELEGEAGAALAVGDVAAAVQYLDWAAELSDTRSDRQRRAAAVQIQQPYRFERDPGSLRRVEGWSPGVLRDVALAIGRRNVGDDPASTLRALDGLRHRSSAAPSWLADVVAAVSADLALSEADPVRALELAAPVLARPVPLDLRATLSAARSAVLGRLLVSGPDAALAEIDAIDPRTAPPDAVLSPVRTGLLLERAVCSVLAGRHTAGLAAATAVLGEPFATPDTDDHLLALLATAHAHHELGRWDTPQGR